MYHILHTQQMHMLLLHFGVNILLTDVHFIHSLLIQFDTAYSCPINHAHRCTEQSAILTLVILPKNLSLSEVEICSLFT